MSALTDAITRVQRLTGSENATDIQIWLEQSIGTDSAGDQVYRVYYVCGLELWLRSENNLKSGEGAVFDQNIETARRFFVLQSQEDYVNELTFDASTNPNTLLARITGNNTVVSSILSF